MPIFGWIRDALGIHKDNVEIDKAELEIKKLEAEELARNFITPATMEDIKEYDPTYLRVTQRIRLGEYILQAHKASPRRVIRRIILWIIFILSILLASALLVVPEWRGWLP